MMVRSRFSWGCFFRLGLIAMVGTLTAGNDCAQAQITSDNTLGKENSVVNRVNEVSDRIDGGASRGANLFHSFREFNVGEGRGAYFSNPNGVENIFSRVTGRSRSEIGGTLGVLGEANLFLINPNGILFGPNASLDVEGSFVGTTANAIGFGERGFFSATDPEVPSQLLTVNPSAFFFNQLTSGSIENGSRADAGSDPSGESGYFGLRVPDGRSLLLLGGDVNINGGEIVAFGSHVELGGVRNGTVGLNIDSEQFSLNFLDNISRADVSLTNDAGVVVASGGGGSITITASNINILEGSSLYAGILSNLGAVDAQAGDITLDATGTITFADSERDSFIVNNVFSNATGNSGGINITTGSLFVKDGAQIQSEVEGEGNSGKIIINASNVVSFDGRDTSDSPSGAFSIVSKGGTGNAGGIEISAPSLSMTNHAQLLSNTEGIGDAGNVDIQVEDEVKLVNSSILSEITEETGVGKGGDIIIKTRTLLLQDGSALLADTENFGNAGSITIEARDRIVLQGERSFSFP